MTKTTCVKCQCDTTNGDRIIKSKHNYILKVTYIQLNFHLEGVLTKETLENYIVLSRCISFQLKPIAGCDLPL